MKIRPDLIASKEEMSALRRSMHMNPQTAYEEVFAADLVKSKLNEWGIPYEDGIAETGIVATIEGTQNTSGKRLGLRADMDALDVSEKTGLSYCSINDGKMHACGHDGHTAILLAATKYLNETREFDGTLNLIFQPAEEGQRGADRMIEEGLFEKYPVDAIYGLHNWPDLPVGKAELRAGPFLASSNRFYITISGKGGHIYDSKVIDPVVPMAKLVQAIHDIREKSLPADQPALMRVTNVMAGTGAPNVVGESLKISGSARFFDQGVNDMFQEKLQEATQQICEQYNCQFELDYQKISDPVINTEAETLFATDALKAVLGEENVNDSANLCMGGEDFGSFLKHKPGAYIFMGQSDPSNDNANCSHGLHSPYYDFNDDIIPIGASYFVELVEKFMPIKK